MRPRGLGEQRFAAAHLFGAVCPERDAGVALVPPEVSTVTMNRFLAELARAVPEDAYAVLVLDRAGWHVGAELIVPAHLPLHRPALNPVETIWRYRRERWLGHRALAGGHEAVVDAPRGLERAPGRARPPPLAHQPPLAAPLRANLGRAV